MSPEIGDFRGWGGTEPYANKVKGISLLINL